MTEQNEDWASWELDIAIISNGYEDGDCRWIAHCEDAPAIVVGDCEVWYWHGSALPVRTQEDFEKWKKLKAFW
jgi:hypothetical protein